MTEWNADKACRAFCFGTLVPLWRSFCFAMLVLLQRMWCIQTAVNALRYLCRPPLQQAPELQAMLPPERPAQLLTGSAGFSGQPAKATVQMRSAFVPPASSPHRQGPKYCIMYRCVASSFKPHSDMRSLPRAKLGHSVHAWHLLHN